MSADRDVARMLTLVPWLLARPGASLAEAAHAFAVDEATIVRDLYHLDFCGLPGLRGGDLFEVEIVKGRVVVGMADELTRPVRPTAREAFRLVFALDAVAAALGPELPALRSALAKVRANLGIPEQQADVVDTAESDIIARVRAAVRDGRRVHMRYRGRADDQPHERVVDPWALDLVDGEWYLQGHDRRAGERRAFRLDRVVALEVTDEPLAHPAPDELPAPRYIPAEDDLEVELGVDPGAHWILDAFTLDRVEPRDDGGVRAWLRTDAPGFVAQVVASAGGTIEVVAPASLRVRVHEEATTAARIYTS